MAVYIDDSGSYGFDALFIGVEDTAWSRDATNKFIWFSSTGTCETGLTLLDTEWIVYEVYANDVQSNNLTGGNNVYAWVEYTTTIGTIATTLSSWYTAWDSEATTRGYTTYSVKATHYKGSELADVYDADDTGTFGTATVIDGRFTGYGSEWVISDTLLAESVYPELVENGDFSNGTTNFTFATNTIYSVTDEELTFNRNTGAYSNGIVYDTAIFEAGVKYDLSIDILEIVSTTAFRMFVSGIQVLEMSTVGTHSLQYIPQTAGSLSFALGGSDITNDVVMDNISVKESAPDTYGNDIIIGNDWSRSDNSGSVSTLTPDGNSGFELDITTGGTSTAHPSINLASTSIDDVAGNAFEAGKTYRYEITTDSLTSVGGLAVSQIYDGGGFTLNVPISVGVVSFEHTFTNDTANTLLFIYMDGFTSGVTNWVVSDVTIREVL